MKIIVSLICFMLVVMQSLLTYAWTDSESEVLIQFTNVFSATYENGVPLWSELAFSIGRWWYVLPSTLIAALIYTWVRSVTLAKLAGVTLIGALGFFAMLYAMYPLQLMPGFPANA